MRGAGHPDLVAGYLDEVVEVGEVGAVVESTICSGFSVANPCVNTPRSRPVSAWNSTSRPEQLRDDHSRLFQRRNGGTVHSGQGGIVSPQPIIALLRAHRGVGEHLTQRSKRRVVEQWIRRPADNWTWFPLAVANASSTNTSEPSGCGGALVNTHATGRPWTSRLRDETLNCRA